METAKIIMKETLESDISKIIEIETSNAEFIGQYDYAKHKQVIEDPNSVHFSVFDKSTNALVGYVILFGLNDINNAIEFRRIAILRKGLGFGRDAIQLIQSIYFGEYKAHRLFLSVFSDNETAIKLYDSLGFKREGLIRECIKKHDGGYRSMWTMSMLVSEFIPSNYPVST